MIKSALGELTDRTNEAKAFTLLVPAYTFGQVAGPAIGGYLANPAERYPKIFGHVQLFKEYKYLLPCLVAGLFPIIGALVVSVFFQEVTGPFSFPADVLWLIIRYQTLPNSQPLFRKRSHDNDNEGTPFVGTVEAAPTIRETLTPRVRQILLNYSLLAFTSMAMAGMLPLFLFTPVHLGGTGFSEGHIGLALSGQAVATVLIQLALYAPMQARVGTIGAFRAAAIFYPFSAVAFPIVNIVARLEAAHSDGRTWTWIALAVLLCMMAFANLTYSGNMLLINAASPSQRSLATLNGLSAMLASVVRSAALAGAPSLFALSIDKHLIGGQAVWVFITLCGLSLVASSWTIRDAKAAWRND